MTILTILRATIGIVGVTIAGTVESKGRIDWRIDDAVLFIQLRRELCAIAKGRKGAPDRFRLGLFQKVTKV